MSGFGEVLTASDGKLGPENVLDIEAAKKFATDAGDSLLFLDVQDPGSAKSDSAYNASLGTLFYKADPNGPAPDEKITAQHPAGPILVACAAGGQAKIAGGLLADYGYTNVKTLNGACINIK